MEELVANYTEERMASLDALWNLEVPPPFYIFDNQVERILVEPDLLWCVLLLAYLNRQILGTGTDKQSMSVENMFGMSDSSSSPKKKKGNNKSLLDHLVHRISVTGL